MAWESHFIVGLGGILSRPVILAEYPKAHFPGWTLWAGVISLVVGLYLVGAVIWDWPFPGRGATGETTAVARQPLVLTVRRHDAYMERIDPPPGGRMLIKLSVAIYVHNPNASAVSVPIVTLIMSPFRPWVQFKSRACNPLETRYR